MSTAARVLIATAEAAPFARTGGLGDVLGALPRALADLGVPVHVVMPGYSAIDWSRIEVSRRETLPVWTGGTTRAVEFRTTACGGVTTTFVIADDYFGREHLYGGPSGDYADNAERFAFLSRAVVALAAHLEPRPAIVHCHDWHTALVPALARIADEERLHEVRTVLTIHNLGYQGLFPTEVWPLLGIDWRWFTPSWFEFYGQVNFLKAGLVFADALTTVSRRYAEEILEPEHGHGLDGVLRERRDVLRGIVNGVDYGRWDPAHDRWLAAPYDATNPDGKARCKAALQALLGLPVAPRIPVLGMVTRLADQKGVDLLAAALPSLFRRDLQLAFVAGGDARWERALLAEARRVPDRLAVRIAFDEPLAHRLQGGADAILVPSRYEPCGLTQLYGLRYGTVPIVRATGGLDDTVEESDIPGSGTGFKFGPYTPEAFVAAVDRALAAYARPDAWRRIVRAGMSRDFSWRRSAEEYRSLYQQLTAPR